jgi:hypothetical protein
VTTRPPWPFMSPLADKPDPLDVQREEALDAADEQDSPYCECDLELMLSELDSGKCAACGKKVLS